jgi:hypothetical protein
MAYAWIETVAEAQRRARRRLRESVYIAFSQTSKLLRWGIVGAPGVSAHSFVMISLTGRGREDILGTVNGGGDGFMYSSHSHVKSLLPICCR